MLKNILKILAVLVVGGIGGIFANEILWPYLTEGPVFYQYQSSQKPVYITEKKEITIQENTALENAIEKKEEVVIGVKTRTNKGKILEGSGLVLTSDGLVVTLAELVPYNSDFGFFVGKKKVHFRILKRNLEENLALIKIEKENLAASVFADTQKIKLGQRVFLIGVIFEKQEREKPILVLPKKIVNQGIIKSFGKDYIKTNIFEKPILNGSPLFNIEGKVLGINTIDSEGKVIAIPISKIKSFAGF